MTIVFAIISVTGAIASLYFALQSTGSTGSTGEEAPPPTNDTHPNTPPTRPHPDKEA